MVFKKALEKELGVEVAKEFKFCESRRWRFDYCIIENKVAIEIEGGVWTNGRHTRGKGFINDMEKYNMAVQLGWKLLRYTPQQMYLSTTFDQIKSLAI